MLHCTPSICLCANVCNADTDGAVHFASSFAGKFVSTEPKITLPIYLVHSK